MIPSLKVHVQHYDSFVMMVLDCIPFYTPTRIAKLHKKTYLECK